MKNSNNKSLSKFCRSAAYPVAGLLTLLSPITHNAVGTPPPPPLSPPAGGANSPPPSAPNPFSLETTILDVGDFAVMVPDGSHSFGQNGAALYSVPGPVAAFRGSDGIWRGRGYLETRLRLLNFTATTDDSGIRLLYKFENDKRYEAVLRVAHGVLLIDEVAGLGPRDLFVFDAFYNWQPTSGFATSLNGDNVNYLYLPAYYDKPEFTFAPSGSISNNIPGGAAFYHPEKDHSDVAGFFVRNLPEWQNADGMGFQLWQRRQLPGRPESRHFQAPETKSDSTPNPRTAPILGQSLYEGHLTLEFRLFDGSRHMAFMVTEKPDDQDDLSVNFRLKQKELSQ